MALVVDDHANINPNILKSQILELLENPRYAEAALKARAIFRDQPQTPAQRLQYAVDYTLRHQGAYHLSSKAALQLNWFQFYLIDVFLFIAVVALIICVLLWLCLKKCLKCCRRCCYEKRKNE